MQRSINEVYKRKQRPDLLSFPERCKAKIQAVCKKQREKRYKDFHGANGTGYEKRRIFEMMLINAKRY